LHEFISIAEACLVVIGLKDGFSNSSVVPERSTALKKKRAKNSTIVSSDHSSQSDHISVHIGLRGGWLLKKQPKLMT